MEKFKQALPNKAVERIRSLAEDIRAGLDRNAIA